MMIKVLSLFSGIGAFEKALKKQGIDYKLVNYCEIDKYASQSYSMIHGVGEDLNLGDITKIDPSKLPKDIDLLTHGSPCQSFSLAGKQAGGDEGSGTQSSLMWYTVDIVSHIMPKIVVWENVKNVLSTKHIHNFHKYTDALKELGYNNYYKVLNAKDYGIPQNRERIFVVSIRNDVDLGTFDFPRPIELTSKIKDFLDLEVDEKYYMTDEAIQKILNWKAHQKPFERVLGKQSICPTLTARGAGENHSGMILYCENIENTRNLQEELFVICEQRCDEGLRFFKDNVCGSLRTTNSCGDKRVIDKKYNIRKITPLECFRLMGFEDEDFYSIKNMSNRQLYKQAGNSIVVNVLEAIYKNLFNSVQI